MPIICLREEVLKFVKSLYGFGDYAAGNVAMLLGFYEDVPMDSETVSTKSALASTKSDWNLMADRAVGHRLPD